MRVNLSNKSTTLDLDAKVPMYGVVQREDCKEIIVHIVVPHAKKPNIVLKMSRSEAVAHIRSMAAMILTLDHEPSLDRWHSCEECKRVVGTNKTEFGYVCPDCELVLEFPGIANHSGRK